MEQKTPLMEILFSDEMCMFYGISTGLTLPRIIVDGKECVIHSACVSHHENGISFYGVKHVANTLQIDNNYLDSFIIILNKRDFRLSQAKEDIKTILDDGETYESIHEKQTTIMNVNGNKEHLMSILD